MSGIFSIKNYLDGFYNDTVFYHSPDDYLHGLNDYELWNMDIALGTSNWDICLDANLKMSKILATKNMEHWLDIRQNQPHDWPLWKEMFPHYLSRIQFS